MYFMCEIKIKINFFVQAIMMPPQKLMIYDENVKSRHKKNNLKFYISLIEIGKKMNNNASDCVWCLMEVF